MITTKKATKILIEPDQKKRADMIEALTEEDAKRLLKHAITVIRGDGPK